MRPKIRVFKVERNSKMVLNKAYFWTSTIKDWIKLLQPESYKQLIIETLKDLVDRKLIKIYAFVIMHNHVHIVWKNIALNGKEMPAASFNKKIAHEILKDLKLNNQKMLQHFMVQEHSRSFRIWQRDALAILMDNRGKLEQKISYIHRNPLQERWNLVAFPEDYKWSSAKFYHDGIDEFQILTHYMDLL